MKPNSLVVLPLFLLLACGKPEVSEDSTGSPTPVPKDSPRPVKGLTLEEERMELDRTVWKEEVAAQEHEQTFIRFWDRLRKAKDRFSVAESFALNSLKLGSLVQSEKLDNGVVGLVSTNAVTLDATGWQARLAAWKQQGWEIVQTEWHHGRFTPSNPAKSEFNIVLHVKHPDQQRRLSVHGAIQVTWHPEKQGRYWLPDEIDATGLRASERRGKTLYMAGPVLDPVENPKAQAQVHPVLVHDLDGDGLPEVILAGVNKVYWNRGGLKFEAGKFLEQPPANLTGAVLGDFTGDGQVDCMAGGPGTWPVLYPGTAEGKFSEPGQEQTKVGERLENPLCLTAGDIDGDGDLDVWLTQYKNAYLKGQMPTPYFDANDGHPSILLVNDGNGNFADETEARGLSPLRWRRTYSSSFIDLDRDGDQDLLVVSDFAGADVHMNDGKGKFTNVTKKYLPSRASFGMAHVFSDFNLDGQMDFYMVGMSSTTARRLDRLNAGRKEDQFKMHQSMRKHMGYGNRLYLAEAEGGHQEVTRGGAIARTGWSWGTSGLDFDLDGDADLYVANGNISGETCEDYCTVYWRHDVFTGDSKPDLKTDKFFGQVWNEVYNRGMSWNGFEHNRLLMNVDSGGRFLETGFLMGVALENDSRAVLGADLDADGRPEILVGTVKLHPQPGGAAPVAHESLHILRQRGSNTKHWVGVRLPDQPSPLGARIVCASGDHRQTHVVVAGDSFRAQHPAARAFGLGSSAAADWVEVTWADGKSKRLEKPKPGEYHLLTP